MAQIVPHAFLFRYSLPVQHVPRLPRKGRKLLNLPKSCRLPDLGVLDDQKSFGDIRAAWNNQGFGISVHVSGKQAPLRCNLDNPAESDGLQVWIDTRNTQSIHRASRFCHHFCVLPAGAGKQRDEPSAVQVPIARAREETPLADPKKIPVAVERLQNGYRLEAWFPAAVLQGFDPAASPLFGFYCYLRDSELGEQFLTVGREFPFASDPSLWVTLELSR